MNSAHIPDQTSRLAAFGRRRASLLVCLAIAVALAVRYWSVLTYPLYWDAISGPFFEAIWLKEHNFDYVLLWQQDGYHQYGPAVYLISILPTFYAILLSCTTPVVTFVVVRCLNFLGVGLVVVLAYRLLRPSHARWHRAIAIIVLASLVLHPMYSGQIAAVNMEIATSVTTFVAGYLMIRRRYGWACAAAILAFFR